MPTILPKEDQLKGQPNPNTMPGSPQATMAELQKKNSVTKLAPVDASQYYKGPGSTLGTDIESAYWNMFNNGGGGGGAGAPVSKLSLADRSNEFGDFQTQATKYTSDLMKGAADTANGMFGQGTLNQMTGDNDQVVQADIAALQEQFGGNVNHPAFIKAKNEMLQTAKMFNARAYTDLKAKAAAYGVQVGEMAKNYYDVFSTREESQQKLIMAKDQFNIEQEQAAANRAAGAANAMFGQQLAALSAIASNRKWEAEIGLEASKFELEARSADKVSQMNLALENKKLSVAQNIADKQNTSNIISGILGFVGTVAGAIL